MVRDDDSRICDGPINDERCAVPESQTFGRVDDKEDGEHLNGNDDAFDCTRFLGLDEMIVIFLYQSLLRAESMSNPDCADDFFSEGSSLRVVV